MRALPAYDLGPGQQTDEVLLNVLLYGMTLALLLSVLWVVLWPFVQGRRDRRSTRSSPQSGATRAEGTATEP